MPEFATPGRVMPGDDALEISTRAGRAFVGLAATDRTTRRVSECISA